MMNFVGIGSQPPKYDIVPTVGIADCRRQVCVFVALRRIARLMALLLVLATLVPRRASAELAPDAAAGAAPARRTASSVFGDIKDYATAPVRWDRNDWLYFGGAIAAIAAAHNFDEHARRHFTIDSNSPLNGKDPHSLTDAVPAAAIVAGSLLYALAIDDDLGRTETWSMLEAAGLSSATAYVFKYAAGRERPNQTTNDNQWRKRGSSFPSLHVTAATAIGTVLAESGNDQYRWIRRFIGYGIAAGTGYLRLKHNEHWLSDTVAAAALGESAGRFVVNREYPVEKTSGLSLAPMNGGIILTYNALIR